MKKIASPQTQILKADVLGMHCASCAYSIEKALKQNKGIDEINVNYALNLAQLKINENFNAEEIKEITKELGYDLRFDASVQNSLNKNVTQPKSEQILENELEQSSKLFREKTEALQQTVTILPFIIFSLIVMTWEAGSFWLGWPNMPLPMSWLGFLLWMMATLTLVMAGKKYFQAVGYFFKGKPASMNTLVGLGSIFAYVYSSLVVFFPGIIQQWGLATDLYFDVILVVIGFVSLGRWLELRARHDSSQALNALISLLPRKVERLNSRNEFETIELSALRNHDVVLVKAGGKVPADGEIIEGECNVDESMITGESLPINKNVGKQVVAGSLVSDGSILVKVKKIGQDTFLAQIINYVSDAQASKAPVQRTVDKLASIFVPLVLIIAFGSAIFWLSLGLLGVLNFSQAIQVAISALVGVLVIACPCAMGLATPMALVVGIGGAAKKGILIKDAVQLEKTSQVKAIIFDKTGTLTKGKPQIEAIWCLNKKNDWQKIWQDGKFTLEDVMLSDKFQKYWNVIDSLEERSEHPLAKVLSTFSRQYVSEKIKFNSFKIIAGQGISAVNGKQKYLLGSERLLKASAVSYHQFHDQVEIPIATLVFFVENSQLKMVFALKDGVHPMALQAVEKLKKNFQLWLLSGDQEKIVAEVAKKAGIEQFMAQLKPEEKLREIKKLQENNLVVAMVGDGINDAPALAGADVGIAVQAGTDIAKHTAGITLLGSSIEHLPTVFQLANQTMRTIRQNLIWAFGYNVLAIPIAAGLLYPFWGILLNPALAGIAMVFSSLSVVANTMVLNWQLSKNNKSTR